MKWKLIPIIAVLALGGLAVAYYRPFGNSESTLTLHGIVEIQEVHLGSKVGGRVEAVMIREGDHVKPGDELIRFEVPEWKAQKEQLLAKLQSAQLELSRVQNSVPNDLDAARAEVNAASARFDRMNKGWREEEIRIAVNEFKAAEAGLTLAQESYKRQVELYRIDSNSKSALDEAVAALDRAKGNEKAAKAKVDMLNKGNRPEDIAEAHAQLQKAEANYRKLYANQHDTIALAQAGVSEVQAKLKEIEVNLNESVVKAPEKAVVEVLNVRVGDLVPPGQPVVRVLRTEDMWVKVFVPETKLGMVRLDQTVDVYVDAYPDHTFRGVVTQIANSSEFTARNIQSADERRFQVFAVKIRVDDPQGVFQSGMAVRVILPLEDAP